MKRIIFAVILFLASFWGAFGQTVIISEVADPGDDYKGRFVELYNATSSSVDISGWKIRRYANGGTLSTDATIPSSTSLASGSTYIIAYNSSDFNTIYGFNPDMASGAITGNGDDVYELYNGSSVVDIYGEVGVDGTGEDWEYLDAIAYRNSNVCSGNTTWTSSEWTIVDPGNVSDATPGSHSASCSSGPEIQLQEPINTDVACGYTYDFGTQTTGTNTDVTIRIKNTGTSDLTISSYPISGTNASEFSVNTAPSSPVSSGSYTDMLIRFSPTSTGSKTAKITINNDDTDEGACEINFTAVAQDACVAPANQASGLDLTSNTTTSSIDGSFTATTADYYLVVYSTSSSLTSNPVDGTSYSAGDALGGGTVVDNISGTSFTASSLTAGTEYYFFIFANNNTNCTGGPIYNTTSPLSDSEITIPENGSWNDAGCSTNSTIDLSWAAASGNSTGYLLVVREGATPHAITSLDPSTNLGESLDYGSAATFGTTTPNSRILYKGTGTNVTVTGLTQGTSYTFKLYTYTIGSYGHVYSSGTQQTNLINVPDVSSEASTCGDTESDIAWVNPTSSCFDEVLVVANETSGIDFSPNGNGSSYTVNTDYSAGADAVYRGTGTSVNVTNLTNGTTYYFEIFVRKGTEWSPGVEVSCTPNEITVLNTGDLAIVAINTYLNLTHPYETSDEVCFFAFKDITLGTAIDFTDNGYERELTGKWGETEGTIRFERTAGTIEKGTVICIQGFGNAIPSGQSGSIGMFNVYLCGANDNSNWNISSLNGNSSFDLNASDQIWIMQNGNWTNPSPDPPTTGGNNSEYDGNVLYGWTASGWKSTPGYNSTKGSTLYEGANCFNTNVSNTPDSDKVKFYTDTAQILSQAAWIGEINSSGNWTGYTDNTAYNLGGLDYSGSCIKFHIDNSLGNGAGRWQGGEDNNWFNCANWLNMTVPDETIDVEILSNAENEANIDDTQDDADLFGYVAKCKNLTVEDGGDTVYIKIDDSNDELQVKEKMTLEANSKVYNDNGGTISVDGDIEINDGALLDMHANTTTGSTLNSKGNWIDYNTTDDNIQGFYETGSKVIFMGTSGQTISDATGNETFYDLQMNNASGLDLNSNDLTIAGTLDLSLGDITTGSNNVIIANTATGSIINSSTSSYVNGNLRRSVLSSGSYDFPVGTDAQYELANINLNSSSGITYFDSKFTNPVGTTDISSLGLTINSTPVTTLLDYGYWTITPDAYTTVDYDVTITSIGHTNGGSIATQHTIVKREDDTQDWATYESNHSNSTQSGMGTNPITAKLTGLTSFSDFAIARSDINPLPITLLSFNAKPKGKFVELNWITQSEINNDYFTVEKSYDGIMFFEVLTVAGNGTTNHLNSYSAQDYKLQGQTIYYRLKQTDFDGNYSYSKIISVELGINNLDISFYNNTIEFKLDEDLQNHIRIVDELGRIYFDKNISNQENLKLEISNFDKGIYFVSCQNKYGVITKKIVK